MGQCCLLVCDFLSGLVTTLEVCDPPDELAFNPQRINVQANMVRLLDVYAAPRRSSPGYHKLQVRVREGADTNPCSGGAGIGIGGAGVVRDSAELDVEIRHAIGQFQKFNFPEVSAGAVLTQDKSCANFELNRVGANLRVQMIDTFDPIPPLATVDAVGWFFSPRCRLAWIWDTVDAINVVNSGVYNLWFDAGANAGQRSVNLTAPVTELWWGPEEETVLVVTATPAPSGVVSVYDATRPNRLLGNLQLGNLAPYADGEPIVRSAKQSHQANGNVRVTFELSNGKTQPVV